MRRRLLLLPLVALLAVAAAGCGETITATPETVVGKIKTEPEAKGDPAAGKKVFASAGCASCHTLADAGANGKVGPSLDDAKPPLDLVLTRVHEGKGVMPSFSGQLNEQQIADVAAYVVQATSG